MTDLKTVIVNSLDAEREDHPTHGDIIHLDDWRSLDRLAKAVTDHFLDREKVRKVLIDLLTDHNGYGTVWTDFDIDTMADGPEWIGCDHQWKTNELVDRLIAGLTGGSE